MRTEDRRWWVVALLPAVAVLLSGAIATIGGWQPVGDDAFLVLRARDVFSAHPPLLSSASSGGASVGEAYNHPGPLVQYLNAPFVLIGGTSAAALANATLNAACLVAIAWLARRTSRGALGSTVVAAAAAVAATMGPETLVAPWNPHIATLPFMVLCVAVWAASRGVAAALPIGLVAASLAGQTHLSYLVPAGALAAALVVVSARRTRRAGSGRSASRDWRRAWLTAIPLAVLSVAAPIAEQLANGSDGNLARLLRGGEFTGELTGPDRVARVLAELIGVPPWFLRGSWPGSIYRDQLPSTALTVVVGLAATVAVGAALVRAVRRGDHATRDLLVVAVGGLVVAAVTATRFPLRTGVPVPYFRWAWPLVALLWAAVLTAPVAELLRRRAAPAVRQGLAAAVMAVLSVLILVPTGQDTGASLRWAQLAAEDLFAQADPVLSELEPGTTIRVETSLQEAALILMPSVIEHLDARGLTVTMTDAVLTQQSGEHRRSTGGDDWRVVPLPADAEGPPDGRLLGVHRPLDPEQVRQLDEDLAELVPMIAATTVRLGPDGRAAGEDSGLPQLVELAAIDPEAFLSSPQTASAVQHGLIVVDDVPREQVVDVSTRAAQRAGRSVALWLRPGP